MPITPLSTSRLSSKSSTSFISNSSPHIKQIKLKNSSSFYFNSLSHHKNILNKSQELSQKSLIYRSKVISLTQRKKLTSTKLEDIVRKNNQRKENDVKLEDNLKNIKINQNINSNRQKNKLISLKNKIKSYSHTQSNTQLNVNINKIKQNNINQSNHFYQQQQKQRISTLTTRQSNHDNYHKKKTQSSLLNQSKSSIFSMQKLCQTSRTSHTTINMNMNNHQKALKLSQSKQIMINKKLLNKQINKINQKLSTKKWYSPFENNNNLKQNYQNKRIFPKQVQLPDLLAQQKSNKSSTAQLKVLNLDRLFRKSPTGHLTSVIPLPCPQLSCINTRPSLFQKLKSKDIIHQIIQQYNNLLKITKFKLKQNDLLLNKQPKLYVKGSKFMKNPTFEELMGLKLYRKTSQFDKKLYEEINQISQQVFVKYFQKYKTIINTFDNQQFPEFTHLFISGLKSKHSLLNLQAFTRFYSIFITKTSSLQQKISFFQYFFISSPQSQYIQKQKLIQTLQKLCHKLSLKQFEKVIKFKTDLLSQEQKQKIFLQALIRVLFNNNKNNYNDNENNDNDNDNDNENNNENNNNNNEFFSRQQLKQILEENQQAIDIILTLIEKEQ